LENIYLDMRTAIQPEWIFRSILYHGVYPMDAVVSST